MMRFTAYASSVYVESECSKIWTKITLNTDTFHAVVSSKTLMIVGVFKQRHESFLKLHHHPPLEKITIVIIYIYILWNKNLSSTRIDYFVSFLLFLIKPSRVFVKLY